MARRFRFRSLFRRFVIGLLLVAVLGCVAAWYVGSSLVAPHHHEIADPPVALNITEFTISSQSGAMLAGWASSTPDPRGVVLLLHGIWGSRQSMLDRIEMLDAAGFATVAIDFQSHGESEGEMITIGYLERHDVVAAIQYAREEYPQLPLGVIGVSLGGAAALMAQPMEMEALVIESVFPTVSDAINNRVRARLGDWYPLPAWLLLAQFKPRVGVSPDRLRPIDHLQDVGCPILISSGSEDPHTTEAETRLMYESAKEPKTLWIVDGAAHVDLLTANPAGYRQEVIGFLETHLTK